MAGLVPAIHALAAARRRGCAGQARAWRGPHPLAHRALLL